MVTRVLWSLLTGFGTPVRAVPAPCQVTADRQHDLWVPKTCATCADVLWAPWARPRVRYVGWQVLAGVAGRAMIVGLWA
jgi:hypothetical protein